MIILIITGFTKNSEILFFRSVFAWLGAILLVATGGCIQLAPLPPATIVPPDGAATNMIPDSPSAYPWTDANAVMGGVCFEAALDAAGHAFVLRRAEDHIRLYDLADNSGLCRRPVTRNGFDFSGGRALAGLWSAGKGCTARHDVLAVARDEAARMLTIRLRFVAEGTCDYELVRPFWIALEGVGDYQIAIQVDAS